MIVAFSTSCSLTSVAAIDELTGDVLWKGSETAPQAASGACLRLLEAMLVETGIPIADATLFCADIGPGSFTGVRVGVTLAKSFGYLYGRPVAGASSFDLISVDQTVVLPSKKGEYFYRVPGQSAVRDVNLPVGDFVGFGPEIDAATYPEAYRFGELLELIKAVPAESFAPAYLIEPSISIPKKPFASSVVSCA